MTLKRLQMTLKWVPWFELSIFVVMVLIGVAEVRLFYLGPEIVQKLGMLNQMEEAAKWQEQRDKKIQSEVGDVQKVFDEVEGAFQGELKELHTAKMQDALTLPDTRRLQEEYSTIADVVRTNISQLGSDLTDLVNRRIVAAAGKESPELARLQRRSQEFNDWILKEKERVESERLQARSQELKERLEKEQFSSVNGPVRIAKDLRTLLNEIIPTYSNYWDEAQQIIINVKKDVPGDAIRKRMEKAGGGVAQLLKLATLAQADGNAVKAFWDAQLRSEPSRRMEQQEEAIKSFLTARSQFEANRVARSQEKPGPLGTSASEGKYQPLQFVLYSLLIAQIGLGVFLMVAIYRRVVVAPLDLKLLESATENKLAHFQNVLTGQAHELRQPLTAINAWVWTLQKSLPENSPEQAVATDIRKEVERLDRVVKDYLTRIQPLEPKLVSMKAEPAFREILDSFHSHLQQKSINLHVESAVDSFFRADPEQLKQVLNNLVQNAAQSLEQSGTQGGIITLRARQDKVALNGRQSEVVIIEVEDNGPGIPPEVQERLFDPFFSTKKDSTGLGLTIVAKIIDRHGGELKLKTEPGHGATFSVVLPVYRDGG